MRLGAVFIAICMVVIAASAGATVYLGFGFSATEAIIVALSVLTALGLYGTVATRLGVRSMVGSQLGDLSRSNFELARQVTELSRRLSGVEGRMDTRAAPCAGGHRSARRRDQRAQHAGPAARGNGGDLRGEVRRHGQSCRGTRRDAGTGRRARAVGSRWWQPRRRSQPPRRWRQPRRGDRRRSRRCCAGRAGRRRLHACPGARSRTAEPAVAKPEPVIAAAVADTDHRRRGKAGDHPQRHRCQSHRPLSAADRDAAAAKGALLRGHVPAAHRNRRRAAGRRFHPAGATRRPDGEASTISWSSAACRWCGGCCSRTATSGCSAISRNRRSPTPRCSSSCSISSRPIARSRRRSCSNSRRARLRAAGPIENESLSALADRGFRFSLDNLQDLRIEPRDLAARGFRYIKVPGQPAARSRRIPPPTSIPPISPICSAALAST